MSDEPPILEIRNLEKYYSQHRAIEDIVLGKKKEPVQALDGVSVSVGANEVEGLIGESGCGKTTFLMTVLGLEDRTGGQVLYRGRDTAEFDRSDWKEFRRNVQIVFQDPFDSLDPKLTVRETLAESLKVHDIGNRDERIHDTLERVELRPADRYVDQYPGQLSGGEKQRVSIARALILDPDVIMADEPVSMLDVSTQARILNLLRRLATEEELSMFYISHDLSTVSYICDRINVMYLGRIVESGRTREILSDPKHPYSEALMNAIPLPDPHADRKRTDLDGSTPDPIGLGEGCRFADRCPEVMDICDRTPRTIETSEGHEVACHLYYDHTEDMTDRQTDDDGRNGSIESANGRIQSLIGGLF